MVWVQASPGPGHCVVLSGKISHIASLHPGVNGYWQIVRATSVTKILGGGGGGGGGLPVMDWHPIEGSSDALIDFMLWKPELSAGLISH